MRQLSPDPLIGLQAMSAAVDRFPYPTLVRRQYSASFVHAIHKYQTQLSVDPRLAETIYRIGATVSPFDTTILFARVEYLFNFGPLDRIPPVIDSMKRVASNLPGTWLAEAYYSVMTGDLARAKQASETGLKLNPTDPVLRERLNQFANIGVSQ